MRALPPTGATERDFSQRISELIQGRSNATETVTLTANVTSTVVAKETINENAECFLSPRTATAAAGIASGTIYISAVTGGSLTITHDSNAATDRTFGLLIIGG